MFGSGKHLVAARVLASMHTLSLFCFADAVGGGSVGDRNRNFQGSTGLTHGDNSCGDWVFYCIEEDIDSCDVVLLTC